MERVSLCLGHVLVARALVHLAEGGVTEEHEADGIVDAVHAAVHRR